MSLICGAVNLGMLQHRVHARSCPARCSFVLGGADAEIPAAALSPPFYFLPFFPDMHGNNLLSVASAQRRACCPDPSTFCWLHPCRFSTRCCAFPSVPLSLISTDAFHAIAQCLLRHFDCCLCQAPEVCCCQLLTGASGSDCCLNTQVGPFLQSCRDQPFSFRLSTDLWRRLSVPWTTGYSAFQLVSLSNCLSLRVASSLPQHLSSVYTLAAAMGRVPCNFRLPLCSRAFVRSRVCLHTGQGVRTWLAFQTLRQRSSPGAPGWLRSLHRRISPPVACVSMPGVVRFASSPLHGQRIGEASHPGPRATVDSFRLAVVNPTAIRNKEHELLSLNANIVCASETTAVAQVQSRVGAAMARHSFKVVWGGRRSRRCWLTMPRSIPSEVLPAESPS